MLLLHSNSGATNPNCGKLLRVFSTKLYWKQYDGHVNSVGYGKNEKNWTIRSQAPITSLKVRSMEKVQRLNGFGGVEPNQFYTLIRYSPASFEN